MTDARALFEEVTGRDDWDLLEPVTRESWRLRSLDDHSFIATKASRPADPEEAPPEPMPAPECPARPARPDEIPKGAATVINRARRCGWDVSVSYARGPWLQADGTWHVLSSILVRARRGAQRWAAIWVDKHWLKQAGYKYEFGRAPGGVTLNADELKAFTESEEPHAEVQQG